MPLKSKPQTIQATVERITHELIDFITDELQRRVQEALDAGPGAAPPSHPEVKQLAARPAPSAAVEKKSAPARRAPAALETRPAVNPPASVTARTPPSKVSRVLDMACRVEGCTNRSRGPRMGFICDSHRAVLTRDQQRRARESYKVRSQSPSQAPASVSAGASPSIGPSPSRESSLSTKPSAAAAPAAAAPSPVPAAAVASASPSPEAVAPAVELELPIENGPAPAGSDYALTIDRARLITPEKLGPTVELRFTVARGPQLGRIARGRFPVAGRGLPVLIEAALGERVDLSNPDTLSRLVGRDVLADVVASGNPVGTLAIVRNVRPLPR